MHNPDDAYDNEIDLQSLFAALWRNKGWVVLSTLIGLLVGIILITLVKPVYQANAKVLIERRETVFTRPNEEQNIPLQSNFDSLSVASQVEVMQSRNVLREVAEKLELKNHAEYGGASSPSPLGFLSNLLGFGGSSSSDKLDSQILSRLYENLSIYLVSESRVVALDVRSHDPLLAANIANAITEEYLLTQREGSREDTETASQFLEKEIATLRERVAQSENRVEAFRSNADLLAVDEASTLTKQQLGETLTLLSEVNGERAEAEAKADQIRRLINSGAALDSSSEVQGSPLIQNLREQQVALNARIVNLSTSLLPNHPQVQSARSQLEDLKEEISRQALLIARALEGDAEVAKVRQQELQAEVARLKSETSKSNEQEIKLRALEREAKADRDLLETYLNRFRESIARQNTELLPVNARVIARASVPVEIHFPKKAPTLGILGFAGFFLSSLFILVAELLSARPTALEKRPEPSPVTSPVKGALDENLMKKAEPGFDREESADAEVSVASIFQKNGRQENGAPAGRSLSEILMEQRQLAENAALETDPPMDGEEALDEERNTFVPRQKEPRSASASSEAGIQAAAKSPTDFHPKPAARVEPLSTLLDAVETIEAHDLKRIVVVAGFDDENCADFGFELARELSRQPSVLFIDTSMPDDEIDPPLVGFSDFVLDEADAEEIILQDPDSDLDIIPSGQYILEIDALRNGWVTDSLLEIWQDYSRSVTHFDLGTWMELADQLGDEPDILVFVTTRAMGRDQFFNTLEEQGVLLPGHSMFVSSGDDAPFKSAA